MTAINCLKILQIKIKQAAEANCNYVIETDDIEMIDNCIEDYDRLEHPPINPLTDSDYYFEALDDLLSKNKSK